MRGDENQQVTPLFRLGCEAEQLSQNRQIYKKGDSGLCYRDLGHRKSANYSRFAIVRSEEHTSELQSHSDLVCRLLLEKKKSRRRRPRFAARLAWEPNAWRSSSH